MGGTVIEQSEVLEHDAELPAQLGDVAAACRVAEFTPLTRTSPSVGRSSMKISLSSVLLPDPLGPVRNTNSPLATCNDTSSSARPGARILLRDVCRAGSSDSLFEIGDEIVRILDPDAQTQEPVRNADPRAFLWATCGVRCVARLADQRIHAAEARRVRATR